VAIASLHVHWAKPARACGAFCRGAHRVGDQRGRGGWLAALVSFARGVWGAAALGERDKRSGALAGFFGERVWVLGSHRAVEAGASVSLSADDFRRAFRRVAAHAYAGEAFRFRGARVDPLGHAFARLSSEDQKGGLGAKGPRPSGRRDGFAILGERLRRLFRGGYGHRDARHLRALRPRLFTRAQRLEELARRGDQPGRVDVCLGRRIVMATAGVCYDGRGGDGRVSRGAPLAAGRSGSIEAGCGGGRRGDDALVFAAGVAGI